MSTFKQLTDLADEFYSNYGDRYGLEYYQGLDIVLQHQRNETLKEISKSLKAIVAEQKKPKAP